MRIACYCLRPQDAIDYVRWIAATAHSLGLGVGLKNALELLPDVQDAFDWV